MNKEQLENLYKSAIMARQKSLDFFTQYLSEVFKERDEVGYPSWMWQVLRGSDVRTESAWVDYNHEGAWIDIYSVRKSVFTGLYDVSGVEVMEYHSDFVDGIACYDYEAMCTAVALYLRDDMDTKLKELSDRLKASDDGSRQDVLEDWCKKMSYDVEFVEVSEVIKWLKE